MKLQFSKEELIAEMNKSNMFPGKNVVDLRQHKSNPDLYLSIKVENKDKQKNTPKENTRLGYADDKP